MRGPTLLLLFLLALPGGLRAQRLAPNPFPSVDDAPGTPAPNASSRVAGTHPGLLALSGALGGAAGLVVAPWPAHGLPRVTAMTAVSSAVSTARSPGGVPASRWASTWPTAGGKTAALAAHVTRDRRCGPRGGHSGQQVRADDHGAGGAAGHLHSDRALHQRASGPLGKSDPPMLDVRGLLRSRSTAANPPGDGMTTTPLPDLDCTGALRAASRGPSWPVPSGACDSETMEADLQGFEPAAVLATYEIVPLGSLGGGSGEASDMDQFGRDRGRTADEATAAFTPSCGRMASCVTSGRCPTRF